MRKVKNILLIAFLAFLLLALIVILLFETGVFASGELALQRNTDFVVECVMVLVTICVIPLALRLFKFRKIHDSLMEYKEKSLKKWGLVRIFLLGIPMLINIIAYYKFDNMGYSYLALILFLSMLFVFPTLGKCYAETEEDVKDDVKEDVQEEVDDEVKEGVKTE